MFLGLTGYYWKFIARYVQIAAPLTELLRKDAFRWMEARRAYQQLKEALTTPLVLIYFDFEGMFVVKTDTCDVGIGAVLTQQEHPIAYFSKKLSLP